MNEDPEREILLKLLRSEPVTAVTLEQWLKILQLSKKHRVEFVLYRQLKRDGLAGQLPLEILKTMREDYLHEANRNIRLYRELSKILMTFHQANIPVIPLKGAYLAEQVYGNIAVRPMADIDLLVKKADLRRVDEIMEKINIVQTWQLKQTIKEIYNFGYVHAKKGLRVEIHWGLIESSSNIHIDMDALWERSRENLVANIPVFEMSPEDQILNLCIHASHHVFENGLLAMCDLAETIQRFQENLDWEGLRQRAHLWNAERCLYLNLRLAKELLNAKVPENWLTTIRPMDFELHYLTLAREHLFTSREETEKALPSSSKAAQFWAANSPTYKMALLLHSLFPSRQIMATRYPVSPDSLRVFLYYPVNLKDVLKRNGRIGWLLLRGDREMVSRAERQYKVNALKNWLL